jgi:hypothetical protein
MRSNGSQVVGRDNPGRGGGRCCGPSRNARPDIAKLPKRGELEEKMGARSGAFGENKLEAMNIPTNVDVVEWDVEVPDCCK